MRARSLLLAATIVVSACGGTTPPTTGPDGSAVPGSAEPSTGGSGQPGSSAAASLGPGDPPTVTPAPPVEIPDPTIAEPSEIGFALTDPARVADAVSSLLDLLGIGIHDEDGAPIRPGTADLWLFESEVRGLIAMGTEDATAMRLGAPTGATTADLVEPLAELAGVAPEVIAAAYDEAYTWGDETIVMLMIGGALDLFDPEAPSSRVLLWLALVDGVVGTEPSSAWLRTASLGPVGPLDRSRPTVDLPFIPSPVPGLSIEDFGLLLAHAPLIGYTIPFQADPFFSSGHKGHGGPGDTLSMTARYAPTVSALVAPGSGLPLFPSRPVTGLDGLPVTFTQANGPPLADHADPSAPLGTPIRTDVTGAARLELSLHPEEGDGTGTVTTRAITIDARVGLRDLVSRVFDLPPVVLALISGERAEPAVVSIEEHEPQLEAGQWRLVLTGPRAGAGSYAGEAETFICSAPLVDGGRMLSATVDPATGPIRLMDVLVQPGHETVSVITEHAFDTPADWFADSFFEASITVETRFEQDPKVMIARADWTEGEGRLSIEMTLACPEVLGL